jgi:hypothetical protein
MHGDGGDEHHSGAMADGQPPQRFARARRLELPIVETPASAVPPFGFAWRSPGAEGVMVELAAAGQWPPAEQALRRYVAGRNTTGWQARSVADQPPQDWTVVTVDLWQDFGEFTLTGLAPTAMGGPAYFDRLQLLRNLDRPGPAP